jgi:hypothetical protein
MVTLIDSHRRSTARRDARARGHGLVEHRGAGLERSARAVP